MKVVEELKLGICRRLLQYCQFRLYNKPTQEGIYQHFKELLKPPIPVIIYNVPGRTSSNMLPKTVLRLANDFKNIVAIKEAAGDMVQTMQILKDKPKISWLFLVMI
jgi:4-hydroxy-tetrahydrodipicolinate synthase